MTSVGDGVLDVPQIILKIQGRTHGFAPYKRLISITNQTKGDFYEEYNFYRRSCCNYYPYER